MLILVSFVLGSGIFAPTPPAPSVKRLTIDIAPLTDSHVDYFHVDLSRDGRHLIYEANGRIYLRAMDQAEAIPIPGTKGGTDPFLSPDGERVAFWAEDQLRTVPDSVLQGVWTPDGERITFASGGDLYETLADGTGVPELLASGGSAPLSWTRDGRFLSYLVDAGADNGTDLWTLGAEGGVTESFYQASANQESAAFSPDGKWLAYTSWDDFPPTVWVQPFPPTGGRTEIGRGFVPLWSPGGQELLYVVELSELVSVSVETESGFSFGRPEPLGITSRFVNARFVRNYDITPDGRRFLVVRDAGASAASATPRVHIVLNWHEELKRLVPTSN